MTKNVGWKVSPDVSCSNRLGTIMYSEHEKTIRDNLALATKRRGHQDLGESMLRLFLQRHPEAQPIFSSTPVSGFSVIKFRLISDHVIDSIRRPGYAADNMFSEIYRHRYFDLYDAEYYYALIDAFRDTVEEALGNEWTPEINSHWNDVVQASKATIQKAVRESVLADS